ncbi:MAG: glycosyltransferase family 39 protein [Patescibacteria group bacterium]
MPNIFLNFTAKFKNRFTYLFLLVAAAAAFLRFFALARADVLTDEASLALRSIGYFDWLATPYQTTPLEWLNTRPWWSYLSFHDHPSFSFFLQWLQLQMTDVSLLAVRFWPALYGLVSIYLLYLIAKRLFNNRVAWLAAILLAVNNLHVWVSRLALQESLSILLILLGVWLFLKSVENKKYFYVWGIVLGLALMTKLTTIVLLPVFFTYLIIWRRDIFRMRQLYWGLTLTLLICSPYIIYNIFLYRNFSHFDFQLSFMFKQSVAAWQARPGRAEIPSKLESLPFMVSGLKYSLSPSLFYLFSLSFIWALYKIIKNGLKKTSQNFWWLILIIGWQIVLFIFIGSPARFLALLMPWLSLLLALAILNFCQSWPKNISYPLIIALCLWEAFFSYNTNISYQKIGQEGVSYSRLKYQAYNYGYNQLDNYLDNLLQDKRPAVKLTAVNANIDNLISQSFAKQIGQAEPWLFVYNDRINNEGIVWSLTRRMLYQAWPVVSFEAYQASKIKDKPAVLKEMGVRQVYYIAPTDKLPIQATVTPELLQSLNQWENSLPPASLVREIKDARQQTVFRVYKIDL